jgi:photosystem II stability/assembly factor-like uncharacterized protein
MIACLSPNGQNIRRGDASPTRLLVATLRGVHLLERESPGAPWIDRGRTLDGHHCGSLMVEPQRGGVFAGMHDGGLYFSPDGGETWELRTSGLTYGHVFSLCYAHRQEGVVLYAGTEPASLFRSNDYGESWTELPGVKIMDGHEKWSFPNPPHTPHVKTLTVDPRGSNTMYAGVEQGALLKTVDGGNTWRELTGYSDPADEVYRDVHLVVVHPANSSELFLATGVGLYHSLDAGENWDPLTDQRCRVAYPDHTIVSPLDDNTLFMSGAGQNPGVWRTLHRAEATILRTRDRARSWTDASSGLPEDRRPNIEAMSIAIRPGAFTLFLGTTDGDVFASDDEAESWTSIARLAPLSKVGHFRNLQPA